MLLRLDRKRPEPLRVQLEGELREAIRSGRLEAGERLPSSRELARELGVSRGLVLECYAQLQAEGYLSGRAGSGTRVAAGGHERVARRSAPPAGASRPPLDFRHGTPDLLSFPRGDWVWAMRDACREITAHQLGYNDPRGAEALREVLAAYLRRVRGAVVDPGLIVTCGGVIQGVNLLLRALAEAGVERAAFEDPGHPDHRGLAARARLEAVPVPVDECGMDADALAASRAGAVVLTPAHQSPTGALLAPERRHALIGWAAGGALLIEDDYDAEFRYDREPVGVLQGLAPDRVALVGSVSKTLAPALRLGWVVCPPRHFEAVRLAKEREDRGVPVLDQLALAALIRSGRYDRHLRRMRTVYAGRREALAAALARHAPGVELRGLAAGFHAVVRLPDGASEAEVEAAARERGVGVYGLAEWVFGPEPWPPSLVLGFGNLGEGEIERGIAAIADLLR